MGERDTGSVEEHAIPSTVNLDSTVYYQGRYWNDSPRVQAYMARRATGDPAQSWMQYLLDLRGRPFERALILNCGNGWVERELVAAGVIRSAHGIDISPELTAAAARLATEQGLSLTYEVVDSNRLSLPTDTYDLVVNYAAAHHVAWIDHVFRELCRVLPPDGVFASYDYVGPHRNQYPYDQWQEALRLNAELPEAWRNRLVYPHLPSMLAGDPTEAIHSELILPVMRRYFRLDHCAAVGGPLAYPVLTFNDALLTAPDAESSPWIDEVLARDAAYVEAHPDSTLFAFVVARPDHHVLTEMEQLAAWSAEEQAREQEAAANGGVYYPPTLLQELTQELEHLRLEHHRAVAGRWYQRLVRQPGVRRLRARALRWGPYARFERRALTRLRGS